MTVAQYIAVRLQEQGVTDVFGIPGGVILDLLYAFDEAKPTLTPHLMYHEQDAGFAACGYAQASGKLGVTYATKGPGFTNLVTAIAEAYYESIPVLFITGHSADVVEGMRSMNDQEMDTCSIVETITKSAKRLDDENTFCADFEDAISTCLSGRKGPVLLDVSSMLWMQEVIPNLCNPSDKMESFDVNCADIARTISEAKRPVLLIGDGIRQANAVGVLRDLVEKMDIPVLSSRASHDILASHEHYMGYIGSRGVRYANFVLSKADLIITIGNRMHYPIQSQSFSQALQDTKVLRFDIDSSEFKREVPNSTTYAINAKELIINLCGSQLDFGDHEDWNRVCARIKSELRDADIEFPIPEIAYILRSAPANSVVTCDVGNHEFLVSRASMWTRSEHPTIYSKAFGALGNALGKAIGAYYATRKSVVCFTGDQGLQMNSQELQYVAHHQLPIAIVVLNNKKSGMIYDREMARYNYAVHTTSESGYGCPDWEAIAKAYGIGWSSLDEIDFEIPSIIELNYEKEQIPFIPQGAECQEMRPSLSEELYNMLNRL